MFCCFLSWIATAVNCVLSSLFTFRKRSAFRGNGKIQRNVARIIRSSCCLSECDRRSLRLTRGAKYCRYKQDIFDCHLVDHLSCLKTGRDVKVYDASTTQDGSFFDLKETTGCDWMFHRARSLVHFD